ncbi:MAG: hypothetical protein Q4C58_07535 [Eubacteriales bacterium]|nr:hypothetical protein [Eubacteriales bacterium]
MIITRTGEIIDYFLRENGVVVQDGEFSICLEYNAEQYAQYARIRKLKNLLNESDYKALKFSDGALTEEEYAPVREQRRAWRAEINEIEETFSEPTITREEMDAAEAAALKNYERARNGH